MNLPFNVLAVAKNKLLLLVPMLLCGGVCGFLGARFIDEFFISGDLALPLHYKLSVILWLPLAFLLPIAIHELGHVWAGLLQGFEFKSYTVASFHFYKEGVEVRFKLVKLNLKGFLGLALCLPPGGLTKEELTKRFALYALGGPLSNLLLAGVLLVPYFLQWHAVTKATPAAYTLACFALITGLISLLFFLLNMIPSKSGGFYTDGARVFNMLRGGDEAFLDSAILSVMAASMGGTPPEELDEKLLIEAVSMPVDSIFKNYCHAYLYTIKLQRQQVEQARYHLNKYAEAIASIPAIGQGSVWLELAFLKRCTEQI
ncbi:hypothetical protein GCM10028895_19470 [Pontibacter rugosus]